MRNILKGILVLPLVVAAVGAAISLGSLVTVGVAFVYALVACVLPYVLIAIAVSCIVLGTLWLLGATATALRTPTHNNR